MERARKRKRGKGGKPGKEGRPRGKGAKPPHGVQDSRAPTESQDPRFHGMHTNPTFQRAKADSKKVKLDKRFAAVLTDDRFKVGGGAKVNKRGRPVKDVAREDLKAFYTVDDEGEDGEEGSDGSEGEEDIEELELEEKEEEEKGYKPLKKVEVESRLDYLNRLARGEVSGSESGSTSSSEDDEDDDDNEGAEGEGNDENEGSGGGQADVPVGEATTRIAVMDCDWSHMRAVDLQVLCSSFTPSQGVVKKVTIYPSDFGLKCMAEEQRLGPRGIFAAREEARDHAEDEEDEDEKDEKEEEESPVGVARDGHVVQRNRPGIVMEEGYSSEEEDGAGNENEGFDKEGLRAYERQKLKYYFAVVECDSVATASSIYAEVDGLEFESSGVTLDLRFVPDDISFEGRDVRDSCKGTPSDYTAPQFICKALQQTNVECTWDEDSDDRTQLLTGHQKWDEKEPEDFAIYLQSSSESEESEAGEGTKAVKDKAQLRKLLLGDLSDGSSDESGGEGEIDKGFSQAEGDDGSVEGEGDLEFRMVPNQAQDLLRRREQKQREAAETPWERQERKAREKRASKKERRKMQALAEGEPGGDGDGDGDAGFDDPFFVEEAPKASQKKQKQKKKAQEVEPAASGGEATRTKATKKQQRMDRRAAEAEAEEQARDYDMRAVLREEKMKGKKLRGKRKRREEAREKAPGQDFQVDVLDERFAALVDGDHRFGVERTDAAFKDTEAMRALMAEQKKRRQNKRKKGKKSEAATTTGTAEARDGSSQGNADSSGATGAAALSALVNKLKHKGLQRGS